MEIRYLRNPPVGWAASDIAQGDTLHVLFSGFGTKLNMDRGILLDDDRHLEIIHRVQDVLEQKADRFADIQQSLDSIGIPLNARDWVIMREVQKALRDPSILPLAAENAAILRNERFMFGSSDFSMKQMCDDGLAVCCENSILSQLVFQHFDVRSKVVTGVLAQPTDIDRDGDYEPGQHNWVAVDGTNGQTVFFDPMNNLLREDGEPFPRISVLPTAMFAEMLDAAAAGNVLTEVKAITAAGQDGWYYGVSGPSFSTAQDRLLLLPQAGSTAPQPPLEAAEPGADPK